jgi:hypothetical protein
MRSSNRLFTRVPVGTKYVLEARGPFLRRYIEFPGGRKVALAKRKAASCLCSEYSVVSIVPESIDIEVPMLTSRPKVARHRVRA